MGYVFPDVRLMFAAMLDKAEVDGAFLTTAVWLPSDWLDNLPFVEVQHVGGFQEGVFRTDRLMFNVYADRQTTPLGGNSFIEASSGVTAFTLAESIVSFITGGVLDVAGMPGMIDSVNVEMVPTAAASGVNLVDKVTFSISAHTRPV